MNRFWFWFAVDLSVAWGLYALGAAWYVIVLAQAWNLAGHHQGLTR